MECTSSKLRLSYLALAIGVVCIGCSAIFVKIADLPGSTSAFYRVLFAAVIAIPWCLWRRPPCPSRDTTLLTLAGGTFFAVELVLWQVALRLTSAANATLLVNVAPAWVGILALVVFRERLGPYFWLGLLVALAGMVLIVGTGGRWLAFASEGDILALVGSVFYAFYLLVAQRVRTSMDTLTFLALSVAASVVVLFATCVALHAPLRGFGARAWLALAALGLISHLGGYLAINYALGHLPATSVSVTLLGQPVVTAALSVSLLGERLGKRQLVGGALVLLGIYFVNGGRTKQLKQLHVKNQTHEAV